jgi:uncharacterized repeat protein (TIGR01451 family)
MRNPNRFLRVLLILCLLSALAAGMFSPRMEGVEAMPNQLPATDVVISEFRFHGNGGANDEFVELYNPTNTPVDISGWLIRSSNASGTITNRATIPASTIILPGQYYLIAHPNYSGPITVDLSYSSVGNGITDDGGVALIRSDGTTVNDQVGLSSGSFYKEGTPQSALSADTDQGYERKIGGLSDSCQDDGNNINDFQLINPSNPQNSSAPRRLCGVNADLQLSISTSNLFPIIGENVVFTITVINYGVTTATNVTVRDNLLTIPVDMTYVSDTGLGSYNNSTGAWGIGALASGASAVLSITVTNNTLALKTYYAEVWSSDQFDKDSVPGNTSTTEDDDFSVQLGYFTLNITNSVNNQTPNIGANVVFTIIVSNLNAVPSSNVKVDALLPPGLDFVSASSVDYNNGTGVWNIGSLPAGSTITLLVTAKVMTSEKRIFASEVSASGLANNAASSTVTPIPSTQADLSLTQSWSRSTSASDTAILNITVTNQDPVNAATNVQVRDLLPSGLTYVSHTSGMNYNSGTGIWSVGTILGGTNTTLSITVKVASSGTSTDNFAEVWLSDQFDIDSTPGNGDVGEDDSTNEEVLVADLSLTQTSDISGSNAVFTVRVTNAGPDDASGVVVSNSRLSNIANYTYISSSATGGTTYNPLNGDWTIGSLPVGTTVTLVVTTIIVVIDENLAEISAVTEVDPDSLPDNNSRTEDDDAATPSANLSLTKTVSNINPEVNTNIIFTVRVSNAGYATATNVEVKDILPSGLTYVSHTSGQTYNSSTGIWSVGTISNGGLREIQITALVATYGIRTNNAEVWKSDQSDPNSDPGDSSTTEDDDDSVTIVTRRAILLNEIAWAGTGTGSLAEDEWIELYNPSDASITISGWTIRKNSCAGSVYITIDSGKSVARDGYFLLERGDDDTVGGVAANQIYTTSVTKLDDAGETLYLCDNSGNQIDTANQQGFSAPPNPWPAGTASSPYGSMERQGNSAEQDSVWVTNRGGTKNGTTAAGGSIYGTPGKKNSTGNSFPTTATVEPTDTPTPLPGTVSIPPRPIINEIHARPGFDWNQDGRADVFDEFIEIKNLTAIDISLSGWKLDTVNGKKSFTLPDVTLKPGERIVYYSKETNLLLSDGGETVRLIRSTGKIYDAFTYTVARAEDQSFCRLPDGNPGDSWFEDCVPTPNLANTREGSAPTSPDGNVSPVCNLPDTIPLDFFIPECNGYGADIWNPFYWDFANWMEKLWIQQTNEKWRTFIE